MSQEPYGPDGLTDSARERIRLLLANHRLYPDGGGVNEEAFEELAGQIVGDLVKDISDRRGFQWRAIDEEIQDEIKSAWYLIIHKHLDALLGGGGENDADERGPEGGDG